MREGTFARKFEWELRDKRQERLKGRSEKIFLVRKLILLSWIVKSSENFECKKKKNLTHQDLQGAQRANCHTGRTQLSVGADSPVKKRKK